jgi:hypothetical protein
MAELLTRHRRQDWGGLQGGSGDGSRVRDDFTVLPPESRWDRSIRCELRQGDTSPWQAELDVAQVQASNHHGPGQSRWISMWLLYDQVAAFSSLDFHISHEVHAQGGGTSAPWAENVTTTQRQLRRTPTGFNHVWPTAARSTIDFDAWHWHAYGFKHTTGTDGFAELQIDGDLVYSETGIRTSADGTSWYPKIGWYRWGSISGTDVCYIAGWSLHDSRPTYPGGGGEPTPTPGVSILVPASPGQVFIGELPYQVQVTQAPGGSVLYVGTAPGGIEAPAPFPASVAEGDSIVSNTLDLTNAAAAGQNDTLYAALHNSGGTMLALDTEQVTLFPPSSPPPPSGPVPGALTVESDTEVTIAAQLLDPDVIVPEDRIEWAAFDLPREYEVRRAREKGTGRWLRYDVGLGGHVYDPTADSPLD